MLTLTQNAAAVIRNIEGRDDMPSGTGMRIAANPDGGLDLELRPAPELGDQILDDAGALLFLDEGAAAMLDDKALEAAAQACSDACKPIDDKRGTIKYRTKIAGVLLKRAAMIARDRINGIEHWGHR